MTREASDPRPGDMVQHDDRRRFEVLARGVMIDSSVVVVVLRALSGAVHVVPMSEWHTPVDGRPRFVHVDS